MLLYDRLCKFVSENPTRFFMPGHKGGYNLDKCFLKGVMPFDVTELSKTDNLLAPKGIIDDAQKAAAQMLLVESVYYLTGGATLGLYTALCMCKQYGSKVLLDRGCHKSVLDALILLDLQPVFINAKIIEEFNVLDSVLKDDVEQALIDNSDICAVVITSPSYYGITSDIEKIRRITKKHGIKLIVDGAHGGNFLFLNDFYKFADFTVISTHKTLPSLTGGGMLIVNDKDIEKENILSSMALFSTSSPSYLIMASVDFSLFYMKQTGIDLLEDLIVTINKFKCEISKNTKFRFLEKEKTDPTRVVINVNNINLTGYELYDILEEKYNIICEMADKYNVVIIPSVCSEKADFKKLNLALIEIDKDYKHEEKKETINNKLFCMPVLNMRIRKAFFSKKKKIDTNRCLGEISAETKYMYPPGIPFLLPGQKIDENIVSILKHNKITKITVVDFNL